MTTCGKVRFMANNFAELTQATISYSSQLTSFPFTNVVNKTRSKVWKPQGNFDIIADQNDQLYINDGANKTVTITAGSYTPATLATQIQTDLNAASSNWTVTYDGTTTPTYKFTIANTGSVTLRLTQTTNAIWDDIGFIGTADETGTSFEADDQRNHTSEYAEFDFGYQAEVSFLALVSPLDEIFSLTQNATVNILADNIENNWASPALSETLTVTEFGVFTFFALATTGYRYWRLEIIDRTNPLGPEGLSFGHLYLGDYITLTERNVNRGFAKNIIDPSNVLASENGNLFFDRKMKFYTFQGLSMQFLNATDRGELEQFFYDYGTTKPFYLSLDPTVAMSSDISELTKYVVFDKMPTVQHIKSNIYSIGFGVRELI